MSLINYDFGKISNYEALIIGIIEEIHDKTEGLIRI